MKVCTIEREVEDVYNQGLSFYFSNADITHPFACDGVINTKLKPSNKILKLIIEYKFNNDMQQKAIIAKILVQVIFYLKKFEQSGLELPNVIMVGDKNECFVLHSNDLLKYLDYDIDWSVAPSEAYKAFPDMVLDLTNDESINPFIFWIDENFDFKVVIEKIYDLCENVKRYVRVTEHNISSIFEYFRDRVLINKSKLTANELVHVFIGLITNTENFYLHPKKKNTIVTPDGNIPCNGSAFTSFFDQYAREYTPQERMNFTAIADRLIEDTTRRKQGAFYTPTKFVDYAHRMIERHLGEDWKDKYIVYDCCSGSMNLTRDYRFKELYCSTLLQEELDIAQAYNPEAKKWQMDFLNDGEEKFDKGLLKAMKDNKPIVFFLNPPYGTAGNYKTDSDSKKNTNKTAIRDEMESCKFGGHENLQHQFMYRIHNLIKKYHLTNTYMALFSNPIWLTGAKQGKFLNNIQTNLTLIDGNLFQASHFADVSNNWGISLTLWKSNFENHNITTEYNMNLLDILDNGDIDVIGHHVLYSSHGKYKANDWIKYPIKNKDKTNLIPSVCLKSGLNVDCSDRSRNKLKDTFAGFYNDSNNVSLNAQGVAFLSELYANGHGACACAENFTRCTALFTARRLIENTWINHADEYLAPNEEHPEYRRFEADSIIFSLFDSKSNQTSMRQVTYKGSLYDIHNEFFWMSKDTMKELANNYHNTFMFNDARTDKDRHVFTLLQQTDITHYMSEKALHVLELAEKLVINTMKYRPLFEADHPHHHINTWDAGYYQLKDLWKEYLPDDFKEFKQVYKELADELRPLVYELGFLRN